jgi:hypothetical protein
MAVIPKPGITINSASKQYKRHTGGSRYPVMFKARHYIGLGWIPVCWIRVRPGMTGFIVFSGRINRQVFPQMEEPCRLWSGYDFGIGISAASSVQHLTCRTGQSGVCVVMPDGMQIIVKLIDQRAASSN